MKATEETPPAEAPSYRILWVPVLITLAFFATLVAWYLLPKNEYQSAGHIGPGMSAICAYGYGMVPFLVGATIAAWRAVRFYRLAQREERTFAGQERLTPGLAAVRGTVQVRSARQDAVRVEIIQTRPLGGAVWQERHRTFEMGEFDIVRADGTRIPVEPTPPVRLLDELDQTETRSPTRRARVATLVNGESVYAIGELVESGDPILPAGADYRATPERALVLRRPPGGSLLLSTKPMGTRMLQRSRSYRRWTVGSLALAAFIQLLFSGYHRRAHLGQAMSAKVEAKRIYHPRSSDGEQQGPVHEVSLSILDKPDRVLVEDAAAATYAKLEPGQVIPVRVAGGSTQLGRHATVVAPVLLGEIVLVGGWLLLFLFFAGGPKAWHEQRKLEETDAPAPVPEQS